MSDFVPFDGDYEKEFYDVRLADGEIVLACWPNAGKMCATNGSSRTWTAEDNIEIRISEAEIG